MANCYTQWAQDVGHLTRAEETWLTKRLKKGEEEEDEETGDRLVNYNWAFYTDTNPNPESNIGRYLHVDADEGSNLDGLLGIMQAFLQKFRPFDSFEIEWADIMDKPRAGGFGGGAAFVTAEEIKSSTTGDWVGEQRRKHKMLTTHLLYVEEGTSSHKGTPEDPIEMRVSAGSHVSNVCQYAKKLADFTKKVYVFRFNDIPLRAAPGMAVAEIAKPYSDWHAELAKRER